MQICRSVGWLVSRLMVGQSVGQSINQLIRQLFGQLVCPLVSLSIIQLVGQSVSHSVHASVLPLVGWLFNWLVGWLVSWLVSWLICWLVDWLVDQSENGWSIGSSHRKLARQGSKIGIHRIRMQPTFIGVHMILDRCTLTHMLIFSVFSNFLKFVWFL